MTLFICKKNLIPWLKKSTSILKNDIIEYLEKYKKQSIDDPKNLKINNSIEQIKELDNALRKFSVSGLVKVTNKNTLILILGLIIT